MRLASEEELAPVVARFDEVRHVGPTSSGVVVPLSAPLGDRESEALWITQAGLCNRWSAAAVVPESAATPEPVSRHAPAHFCARGTLGR